jgi:hypothetical protein
MYFPDLGHGCCTSVATRSFTILPSCGNAGALHYVVFEVQVEPAIFIYDELGEVEAHS